MLHGFSAFLLALILRRLKVPGAVLAAWVFALHPVQVESVAWMTELKNILSGTLYLAVALAYLRYHATRSSRFYTIALALFGLALLSKTVTATLPAALLVVFWWQRGELTWRRDVRPLVPFFVLGAAAGATTAWVESTFIGARGADFMITPIERCLIAGRALLFYASKVLWPIDLVFMYPRWTVSQNLSWQYAAPIGVAVALGVLWRWRHRSRAPFAAIVFFGVTLAPALGFLNVYPFRYSFVADHFQYLACIGIIAPTSAALVAIAHRRIALPIGRAEAILCVVLGLPLAWLTTGDAAQYVNAETLYAATLDRNPGCWLCQGNLGALALTRTPPQRDEAMARFRAAIRINPNDPLVHHNLGTTLMEVGRLDEAVEEQRQAIRLAPGYAEAHGNLGAVLQKLGRLSEAADEYRTTLDIKPDLSGARANLAVVLQQLNRPQEARAELQEAARIQATQPVDLASMPSLSTAPSIQLGDAFVAVGQFSEAIAPYRQALQLGVDPVSTRAKLGFALSRAGRVDEATVELRRLVELVPADSAAHANLGGLLLAQQHIDAAVVEFETSLRLHPDVATVHNDLGVALAKLGRRDEAIQHFQEAVRLQPDFPAARINLAKALGQ